VVLERKKGITAKTLHKEYQPLIGYSQFSRALAIECKVPAKAALKLFHTPGERVHIDFCDGISIIDPKTGNQSKTQLFVGVLPFSSYAFATFTMNQRLDSFIRAHQEMWAYFGGVVPYVVPDNLKAGVKKAHRYDPDANPTYCDYGNYMGFAVLPARPYTPRDKASVECNIGVLQKQFFEEVRNEKFYSLAALNNNLLAFLERFNACVMKDYGVSRSQRFEAEKPTLLPYPTDDYEICEWREAKVHPDCCVQVAKNFYSVPFRFIGQIVRVKIQSKLIEIFNNDTSSIACHGRIQGQHKYSIEESHLPPQRLQIASFEIKKSLAMATSVGPKTGEMVRRQLEGNRPLRHLRRVQGILRLLKTEITNESLEFASAQALTFERFQLSFIRNCAKQFQTIGGRVKSTPPIRNPNTVHLHGGTSNV
jgi:hypothetical protein